MAYIVTGALAVVTIEGKKRYIYQGGMLPPGVPGNEISHLLEVQLISEVDTPLPVPTHVPPATPPPDLDPSGTESEKPPRPLRLANKSVWVEYAVQRGMPREEAEARTKDELIAAFPLTPQD